MKPTVSSPNTWRNYYLPMVIIGVIFFVMGFGVGISGLLIPFLQNAFNLTQTQSYLVTASIFSAFVVFGPPSGWVIGRLGYKRSMFIAFLVMALGMFLFVPSAGMGSFGLFLVALFVGGIGSTLLQTAVNPYLTIIGSPDSAAMRICLMGIMNKAAWWIGPLFLGLFLNIQAADLADVTLPFVIVTAILLLLSVFVWIAPLPEVTAHNEERDQTLTFREQVRGVMAFPHLLLGVVAIFVYVGIETLPMASVIDYAKTAFPGMQNPEQYAKYVPIGLVVGYLFGVALIPRVISQSAALRLFAILGLFSSLALIFLPPSIGIWCFAALGFSNSLMWPAIWPLAIADLGRYTKAGSSLLVTGIVGGAVIPLLFGWLVDLMKGTGALTPEIFQRAYWILVLPYLFILYYSVKGYRVRR
ncbi:MAG: glucose/galactose MFS transporter [Marinilabiliaceae bacterium]|nr:glucose/galactose MFS transporter [Marinilabiliaceae bacterium]